MPVKTVGIISPGDMGSAIGGVLTDNGLDVIACLEGRGKLTHTRAAESRIRDVPTLNDVVEQADLLLSVLVPSESTAIAESVVTAMKETGAKPASVRRVQSRRRLIRPCGSKVGAHFTASISRLACDASRNASSWAESSFLPPWRATSTDRLRPSTFTTLSTIARPASSWYGRSRCFHGPNPTGGAPAAANKGRTLHDTN